MEGSPKPYHRISQGGPIMLRNPFICICLYIHIDTYTYVLSVSTLTPFAGETGPQGPQMEVVQDNRYVQAA